MNILAGKSSQQRVWLLGGVLVAFLLLVVGYLAFIAPQRSETSNVDAQVDSARATNLAWQSRITTLRAQSKNLATYNAQARAAEQALPSTSGIPDFLRTLQRLGSATHTDAVSLTVGTPIDVTALATGTAAATPSTALGSAAAATGSVFGLTISAQINGSTSALNGFLDQLQRVQPRAVLITQITEGAGAAGSTAGKTSSGTTLQLTMQAFVAPADAAENAQLAAAANH